jgi:hypothetical protein
VRAFLDSKSGRYFADDVANYLALGNQLEQAIINAVARWETWTITPRIALSYGIPAGLPYLTGMVLDAEIQTESAAG